MTAASPDPAAKQASKAGGFVRRRVVILSEGEFGPLTAKTATGVLRSSPHEIVAVVDSTKAGQTAQQVVGCGGDTPIVKDLATALELGPDVALVGIAPTGGQLPTAWRKTIADAIEAHLEIWSGMHMFLADDEEFADLAERKGVRLWDVRRPRTDLVVASGAALGVKAFVALMVGTDCNLGKMTTALELERYGRDQKGYNTGFVATGQTGILIEGRGTPLDAVPGDFMAGEVERLVVELDAEGRDVILVEGQGALVHPGFGPVSLALMLGAMPDAFVLCHHPTRETYRPSYDVKLPPVATVVAQHENLMQVYKAPKVLAGALNTFGMNLAAAAEAVARFEKEAGCPCADPIRDGVGKIWDALEPAIKAKLAKR